MKIILKSPRKRLGANEADNTVRLYNNFVADADRIRFLEHARCCGYKFTADIIGHPYGQHYRLDNTEDFTPLHQQYLDKIREILCINNAKIDYKLGIMYDIINPGELVQHHVDLYPFYKAIRFVNYRFNFMLSRGDENCYNPVICDKSYDVPVSGAWSFAASLLPHKTEVITGKEHRVVLQFGLMVPMRDYFRLVLQ